MKNLRFSSHLLCRQEKYCFFLIEERPTSKKDEQLAILNRNYTPFESTNRVLFMKILRPSSHILCHQEEYWLVMKVWPTSKRKNDSYFELNSLSYMIYCWKVKGIPPQVFPFFYITHGVIGSVFVKMFFIIHTLHLLSRTVIWR